MFTCVKNWTFCDYVSNCEIEKMIRLSALLHFGSQMVYVTSIFFLKWVSKGTAGKMVRVFSGCGVVSKKGCL